MYPKFRVEPCGILVEKEFHLGFTTAISEDFS